MKQYLNDVKRVWIKTSEETKELWNWIDYLSTPANVRNVLKQKFERNDFDIDYLDLAKQLQSNNLEKFELLSSGDFEEQSLIIATSIKQAKEYFTAAKNSSPLVSPVLYYYGMVAFGNALINSIFKYSSLEPKHGLEIDRTSYLKVSIKRKGFFPRLHNVYSSDILQIKNLSLTFKQLMSVNPELKPDYIFTYDEEPNCNTDKIDFETNLEKGINPLSVNGSEVKLHPIDIHFIGMYILSSFCRYKPKEWSLFMNGEDSNENFIVKKFLANAERRFPNLILNEIWRKQFLFSPGGRWG